MLSFSSKKLCNKNSSSSTSASIIGNNSDPLTDILYCLPAKSLGLFKLVSKQWLSLISDPYFEKNYNLRNRLFSTPALFMRKQLMMKKGRRTRIEVETVVMDDRNGVDYIPCRTPNSRLTFKQSCNGLVLCEVSKKGPIKSYAIYNPSMKHCKTLPSIPLGKSNVRFMWKFTIAFDPAKSIYYEIVAVRNLNINVHIHMHEIQIYSSKTDSWRVAEGTFPLSPPGLGYSVSVSGVYWNGSVHWLDTWSTELHYFDIECEVMKKIALPTEPDEHRRIVYFGECRGHMHFVEMHMDDMPRYDIWEMRKDYTGWNSKYRVDLTPLRNVYPGEHIYKHHFELYVLLLEDGQDSSRLILWMAKQKVIVSFDLKNKSFKKIYDLNLNVTSVKGFQYMETLAQA